MAFNNSKVLPSSKCVYVDNDAQALRQQGLLAFNNLGDALNSWDSNGEATKRFGYPSATAPATIILGGGTITSGQTEAGGTCYLNNDYVNIIGQGVDITILTNAASSNDGIINYQPSALHNVISHFTIKCGASSTYAIKWTGFSWTSLLNDIKVNGNPSSGFIFFSSANFRGTFENCIFDFSAQTGTAIPCQLGNANSGIIRSCSFIGSSTCPNVLYTAGNDNFYCVGCTFSGSVTSELVKIDGFTSNGRFVGCIFEAFTGRCVTITLSSTPEVTFEACNLYSAGNVCFSIASSPLTKIINCFIETTSSNKEGILLNAGSTGCVIFGCRIIGQGSGKAINSSIVVGIEVSHCTLRKPSANTATQGSSIGSTIQNIIWNPNNVEIESLANTTEQFPVGGLISWWKLDEPEAWIRKDSYGLNHLAPFAGGPAPNFDNSLINQVTARFTGTNADSLNKSGNGSLQLGNTDFTITAWFRTINNAAQYPMFVSKGGNSTYEFYLYHYGPGNQVVFDVAQTNGTRLAEADGPGFSSNVWNFVVGWVDTTARTVNVQVNNGTVFSSAPYTSGLSPSNLNGPWYIGGDALGLVQPLHIFSGDMADVGFYKRVLNATERSTLYNGGNGRTIQL